MRYLNEHQFGYDKVRLGFPSVGGCAALVLATTEGLYGFHLPPTTNMTPRYEAFKAFMDGIKVPYDKNNRLYLVGWVHLRFASTNTITRFGVELKEVVRVFGHPCEKRAVDLRDTPLYDAGNSAHACAYVEFIRFDQKCKIYAKPWSSDMDDASSIGVQRKPSPHFGRVKPSASGATPTDGVGDPIRTSLNTEGLILLHTTRFW